MKIILLAVILKKELNRTELTSESDDKKNDLKKI